MFRYLPLMLKNSLRNRRRSVLTIFSIAASLCLLGVMFALYRGLFLAPPTPGQELRLVTHHKVSITQPIPAYFGDKIRQVPGVREAMIWQWFGGTYKDARDQKNFFARFCVEPDKFFKVRPEIVMPEDQKQTFLHLRTAAIASSDLVERMNWKIGEKIFLTGDIFQANPELTLVGVFNDPNTSETLFFSNAYLREMLGAKSAQQDLVGTFQVQVENVDAVPRVIKAIDDMFANSQFPTKSESEQAFGLQFISFLGNIKLYLMSICAAVTFTILLVSANTMAMSVRERIREVGILKTLGYTPGAILFIILGEAGVISIVGGSLGMVFAMGLTSLVRRGPSFMQAMKTLAITPDVGAICIALAVFIGVVSSTIPALTAARTPILESLRSNA
ncbi:MAG TPA: FtsX-like permease family protein [Bryobacteraceae bacterium]|nr:FtsX-like permease family protein [Bryobacteraceae bacterium]